MGIGDHVWIIDDGPLGMMADEITFQGFSSWPTNAFFVAQATWDAAQPSAPRRNFLQTTTPAGEPVVRPFEVMAGGEADDFLYGHLRRNQSYAANLAEHQAIVWALLERPDAVFVTADKKAAMEALSELGRTRVCHPFEFWNNLLRESLISESEWNGLCGRQLRGDRSLPGIPWRFRTASGGNR